MLLRPDTGRIEKYIADGFKLESIHCTSEYQYRFVFSNTKQTTQNELVAEMKRHRLNVARLADLLELEEEK